MIIKCHKRLWDAFIVPKEVDGATPHDEREPASQSEVLPEAPACLTYQHNFQWPLISYFPQQNNQFAAGTYSDPFLSAPFSPGQQPLPLEGPTLTYGRPKTPQRANSFWSDSGFGNSSICGQCRNGRPHRCPTPVTPSTGTTSDFFRTDSSSPTYPATVNPAWLQKGHAYGSTLESLMFPSSTGNDEDSSEPRIQSYCSPNPNSRHIQRGPQ